MALSNFIPAIENPLFLFESELSRIQNGSSIAQLNYPIFYNVSSHVNLTFLPDNVASLTFNSTDPFLGLVLPLSSVILNQDAIRMYILCTYPLSGSYDTLSRVLFYVLMIFSLVFQRFKEISIAALVTAMTYAAVSAVHALALVTLFQYKTGPADINNIFSAMPSGDPDLYGLFPILAVSGIMLAPILMWSSAVRDHHGQAVILAWGILILTALGAVVGTVLQSGENSIFDIVESFAVCTNTSPVCRSFALNFLEGIAKSGDVIFPKDLYNQCGCIDYCSTFSPASPMRKGANMVALSTYDPKFRNSPFFTRLTSVGLPVLVFVFISGIFGLLQSQWSQEDARNAIFASINSKRFTFLNVKRESSRVRTLCAKCIAASFFLTSVLVTVLAPVIFVFAVVSFELYLVDFPQSEYSDSVGAWGNSVGAALVLLATIFAAIQGRCADYIRSIFGHGQHHRKSHIISTPKQQRRSFIEFCLIPIQKAKAVVHRFKTWWKDPEQVYVERQQQREEEKQLKRALEDEKVRHRKEVDRLLYHVKQLRSQGQRTCVTDPTTFSTELKDDPNQPPDDDKPFFYNGLPSQSSFPLEDQKSFPFQDQKPTSNSSWSLRDNQDSEAQVLREIPDEEARLHGDLSMQQRYCAE